jgi:uroporphyrinogen decarboxylase
MRNVTRREVMIDALECRQSAYVPWASRLSPECIERMKAYLGGRDLGRFMDSHLVRVAANNGHYLASNPTLYQDDFGVLWDRSVDRDIGRPVDQPLKRPEDLAGYEFPDSTRDDWYAAIPGQLAAEPDRLWLFAINFTLFERAWTLRGMDNLLMDMVERPEWVETLLARITEHNLGQIRRAVALGVDAVYFTDDYGMQSGLMISRDHWRHFFKPGLARLFAAVREAGKYTILHSCGNVAELFDDLVEIGLHCFNPFQPEVMDIVALKKAYHGRLAFYGGLSLQKTLPLGSPDDVRRETEARIALGREGGYIIAPSNVVPRDVPPENLAAMMETLRRQPGSPQLD